MAEKVRWGILATGWIADLFVRDLLLTNHLVTAVGSRKQESAQRFAKDFGIQTAHGSYEALVADPNVDIIYIATPHPHHIAAAKLALNAGKHILVEKPFTINAGEAAEIVSLASAKGLVVLEAMWTRFFRICVASVRSLQRGQLAKSVRSPPIIVRNCRMTRNIV